MQVISGVCSDTIFRGRKDRSGEVNPECRRKKIKKAEMATLFFSLDIIPAHRRARHS